jgi:hypothetical protein
MVDTELRLPVALYGKLPGFGRIGLRLARAVLAADP